MTIIQRRMPAVIQRYAAGKLKAVGARQIAGIAATDALSPIDGYALDMRGGNLDRLQNGQLAWNHSDPIGIVNEAHVAGHELLFTAEFGPAGVDDEIDALCAKAKAGVIQNVSLNFRVIDAKPIVGGMRATKWEAFEISLCLVGVDPGAKITARSKAMRRNLNAITANLAHAENAIETSKAAGRHHAEIADATERMQDHRRSLHTALHSLRRALDAGDEQQAMECHGRCMHSLGGLQREARILADRHADATEAHSMLARSLSDVGAGFDTTAVQVSDGTSTHDGTSSRSWDRRRRECNALASAGGDDYDHRIRVAEALELAGKA